MYDIGDEYDWSINAKRLDFPELQIFESILETNRIGKYYQKLKEKLLEEHLYGKNHDASKKIDSKEYERRLANIKKKEQEALKTTKEIKDLMEEYKKLAKKLSDYEYRKLDLMLKSLNNPVLNTSQKTSLNVIRKQKSILRKKMEKLLADVAKMQAINCKLEVTKTIKHTTNDEYYEIYNKDRNGYEPATNLAKIIKILGGPLKLVGQFICQVEHNQIKEKYKDIKVYYPNDYSNETMKDKNRCFISTVDGGFYVSDPQLKKVEKYVDEKQEKDQSKEKGLEEIEPLIGEINDILGREITASFPLDQKTLYDLKITRAQYEKLADIKKEYQAVCTIQKYIEDNFPAEAFSKIRNLLNKYHDALFKRISKESKKTEKASQKYNVDESINKVKLYEEQERLKQIIDKYETLLKNNEMGIGKPLTPEQIAQYNQLIDEARNSLFGYEDTDSSKKHI